MIPEKRVIQTNLPEEHVAAGKKESSFRYVFFVVGYSFSCLMALVVGMVVHFLTQ